MEDDGLYQDKRFCTSINLSYSQRIRPKLDLGAVLNIGWWSFNVNDIETGQKLYRRHTLDNLECFTATVFLRWNWLRRESFTLYSSIGAGVTFTVAMVWPHLTPIGIRYGRKRVYGMAEITGVTTAVGGVIGIGYRL